MSIFQWNKRVILVFILFIYKEGREEEEKKNRNHILTLVRDCTGSLQMRHFLTRGEQREQVAMCAQGPNRVSRLRSEQTMHSSRVSWSFRIVAALGGLTGGLKPTSLHNHRNIHRKKKKRKKKAYTMVF